MAIGWSGNWLVGWKEKEKGQKKGSGRRGWRLRFQLGDPRKDCSCRRQLYSTLVQSSLWGLISTCTYLYVRTYPSTSVYRNIYVCPAPVHWCESNRPFATYIYTSLKMLKWPHFAISYKHCKCMYVSTYTYMYYICIRLSWHHFMCSFSWLEAEVQITGTYIKRWTDGTTTSF